MTEVRTWDIENPDIDPEDYIIGSTLGWWEHDVGSIMTATVVTVARVFVRAGVDEHRAFELAFDRVVPGDDDPPVTISVDTDDDGAYRVRIGFQEDGDAQ